MLCIDYMLYISLNIYIYICVCLFVCFFRVGNHCLPQNRRDGFSLIAITPMSVGKLEAIMD